MGGGREVEIKSPNTRVEAAGRRSRDGGSIPPGSICLFERDVFGANDRGEIEATSSPSGCGVRGRVPGVSLVEDSSLHPRLLTARPSA